MFKLPHNCTHPTRKQNNAQNSPSWASKYVNCELPDVQAGFRKEEPEIKLPTSIGSLKKHESSRKTSALLTTPKPLTVWITTNCGKFFKRWEYQTTRPASWEICMQFKKQQLELDMEEDTGSKLGKEYCHSAYSIYMHHVKCRAGWSTSCNGDCRGKYQ